MVLFVFKMIFLAVFLLGAVVVAISPLVYSKRRYTNEQERNHKVTKLKLIGIVIGLVGLLIVLILSYFK